MNHHDLPSEELTTEELAKIRSSQVKDFLKLVKKDARKNRRFWYAFIPNIYAL